MTGTLARCLSAAFIALSFAVTATTTPALDIDEVRFRELHEQLAPPASEAWRRLPWEPSVLAARARATAEGKPVYLLVRSGHPLGCV